MTTRPDIRQRARELVDQLPGDSLSKAVEFMEQLNRDLNQMPDIGGAESPQERSLLDTIQRQLSPADQARLSYLRQQQETATITDAEHQELLTYVDQVEQQDAASSSPSATGKTPQC